MTTWSTEHTYVHMWHGVSDEQISKCYITGRTQNRGRWKQGNFPIVHLEVISLGASNSSIHIFMWYAHMHIVFIHIVYIHTYVSICTYVQFMCNNIHIHDIVHTYVSMYM